MDGAYLHNEENLRKIVSPDRLMEIFMTAIKEKNHKLYLECIDPDCRKGDYGKDESERYFWDLHQERFHGEYVHFIKEEHQTIALGLYNIIEEFNSESSVVGRLRKCNFTKHRAFFADGTEATGGTPHYTRRIGFLGKAVKARFEKAVRAVFQRHGKQ